MKIALILMAAGLLAGCMPATIPELKAKSKPYVFTVDEGYQKLHRALMRHFEGCLTAVGITASSDVDGTVYTDVKEGLVTLNYDNLGGSVVVSYVQLADVGGATKVIYYGSFYGEGYGPKLEQAIRSGSLGPPCT